MNIKDAKINNRVLNAEIWLLSLVCNPFLVSKMHLERHTPIYKMASKRLFTSRQAKDEFFNLDHMAFPITSGKRLRQCPRKPNICIPK